MKKIVYQSLCVIMLLNLLSCDKKAESGAAALGSTSTGVGGSMARFTIVDNYLYTVNATSIQIYDISNPAEPKLKPKEIFVGFNIETIFPLDHKLFIGSMNGMFIYDISAPGDPLFLSRYSHITSCDPVVADSNYAYVTLRSETTGRCNQNVNQLDIVNIKNLTNPTLLKSYPMTFPKGLGVDGKTLFVCDRSLKVFDIKDPLNIKLKKQFFINADDVIPYKNLLMVIGGGGLHQYSYANDTIIKLSTLN